ncbi:MAG: DUF2029 domain-containing protein [Planctomycetes bacterium]|nr:DUF2029 domain-containing protein [Planctomycetota bacterium]
MTDAEKPPSSPPADLPPAAAPLRTYQKVILVGVVLAMSSILGAVSLKWAAQNLDAGVYWRAGVEMREGGARLYDVPRDLAVDENADLLLYVYPPAFASIFAFFTLFPPDVGMVLWAGVLMLGVLVSVRAVYDICRNPALGTFARFCWALLPLAGTLPANLYEGQINLLVTATACTGLALIARRRDIVGGSLVGLAFHLKVIPIVLIAVLAVQGRWRACLGVGFGLVLFYFTPLIWTVPRHGIVEGIRVNNQIGMEYFVGRAVQRVAHQKGQYVGGTRAPNISFSAALSRCFQSGATLYYGMPERGPLIAPVNETVVRFAGLAIPGALFLLSLLLAWRKRAMPLVSAGAAGLALAAAHLGSLPCWPHHLCALVLWAGPLIALSRKSGEGKPPISRRAFVVIMVLLALGTVVSYDIFRAVFGPGAIASAARVILNYYIWGGPTWVLTAAWIASFVVLWRIKAKDSPSGLSSLLP